MDTDCCRTEEKINRRIRQAAIEEFSRQGYHQAAVDDIADSAGVGKGTVYRHYGNKQQLFLNIICSGARDLQQRIKKCKVNKATMTENLKSIVAVNMELFRESKELISLIVREGFQGLVDNQPQFTEVILEIIKEIEEVFKQGQENGELKDRFDSSRLANLFLGQLWSVARAGIVLEEEVNSVEKNYEVTLDIFLEGIKINGVK
ncbi:MAG: TetR/AcrR family transcriptional regulator [bacterium]